jgi:hypothetical protein
MPIGTFYAYLGKHHIRYPILTVDNLPTSYDSLKDKLWEVMNILYFEKGEIVEADISLEIHLPGKEITAGSSNPSKLPQETNPDLMKKGTYQTANVRWKRSPEFQCKLFYNHLTRTITVKNASFGSHLYRTMLDDYKIEHGKEFTVPPIIPRQQQFLRGNLEAILAQPADMTPLAYEEPPQSTYSENTWNNEPRAPYAETLEMPYEDKGVRTFLEDKFRKEQP